MRLTATLLIGLLAVPATLLADPVVFTHTGQHASGTLNGVPFANALFTFTATADTANIVSLGIDDVFTLDHDTASVTISGRGTFDFITGTRTYVAARSIVAFAREGTGENLYNGPASLDAFLDYDLSTSIGTVVGTASLLNWSLPAMETTGGTLVFNSGSLPGGSFSARVIPSPASAAGLLLGFAAAARRRR